MLKDIPKAGAGLPSQAPRPLALGLSYMPYLTENHKISVLKQ